MSSLAARLRQPGLISCPGVFDMISAKVADTMDFDALYMTGYGVVASYLGLPDAGLATYTDMVGRVKQIAGGTSKPLIADGDTGYGGLLNVEHTVRGYEAAGAAAIQIEDQEFPKKCGHTPNRRVIPIEDAAQKIREAAESRASKGFLIIARTDARAGLGLDEALRRGEAFVQAGADILFIEAPESEEEMRRIASAFGLPLIANMVEGGRTPVLSRTELEEIGFKIAIFPASGFLAMAAVLKAIYGQIQRDGSTKGTGVDLYPFPEFSKLMGFERVWEFERRHALGD
jgi:2-methylisocitrate lyase-like PEP mutase family enzyme